jgi:hypothetical protein
MLLGIFSRSYTLIHCSPASSIVPLLGPKEVKFLDIYLLPDVAMYYSSLKKYDKVDL